MACSINGKADFKELLVKIGTLYLTNMVGIVQKYCHPGLVLCVGMGIPLPPDIVRSGYIPGVHAKGFTSSSLNK